MTLSAKVLRITLTFVEKLNFVTIQVWTDHEDWPLETMGVVKDKNLLNHLMETVRIDHYLRSSGEICSPGLMRFSLPDVSAIAWGPKQLLDALDAAFQRESEVDLKILDGELTGREEFLKSPKSLTVCSSTVTGAAGLERIRGWFAGLSVCGQNADPGVSVDQKQTPPLISKQSAGSSS
jgi:hypothetical protein